MARWICFAVVTLAITALPTVAAAQAPLPQPQRLPRRYYPPAGPTLSPYLDLFRRRTTVFDNYNALVRPNLQLNDQLRQQQRNLQSVNRELQRTQQRLQQSDVQAAPTGAGATFMNYSHYYRLGTP